MSKLWTYTLLNEASIVFTTNDNPTSGTSYLITSVTGTVNGINLDPNLPGSYNMDTSKFGNFEYIEFKDVNETQYRFYANPSRNVRDQTGTDDNGDPIYQYIEEPAYFELYWGQSSYGIYLNGDESSFSVETAPVCFLKGTLISTSRGDIQVERLVKGDGVLTLGNFALEIKWIGRQKINSKFTNMLGCLPICISTGALGNGLPLRDLYVSPDHAMYLDDCMLVHAKALLNGKTIYQVTEWEGDVEYFHIETEHHEIIFAEGAPTETFIDNVSRKAFYNHAEYGALYPDAKPMVELDIPRVKYARQLPMATKKRLDAMVNTEGADMAKTA